MPDPVAITLATVVAIAAADAFRRAAKATRTKHLRQLERQRRLDAIRREIDFIETQLHHCHADARHAERNGDRDGYLKARARAAVLMHRLEREVHIPLTNLR